MVRRLRFALLELKLDYAASRRAQITRGESVRGVLWAAWLWLRHGCPPCVTWHRRTYANW